MDKANSLFHLAAFLCASLLILFLCGGCDFSSTQPTTCERCHVDLEPVSPSHNQCVDCHGGDPAAEDKDISHRAMAGKKNPADPSVWQETCGKCHTYQVQRVSSGLMYTNTGMIKNIQLTWEGVDGRLYAMMRNDKAHNSLGDDLTLHSVAELNNLSGELYRKFCSLCHVGQESSQVYAAGHAAGCAACHFPFNDNGTYQGGDKTVQGKWPYSQSHKLEALPDTKTCSRCHNRSGRIALSYQGKNDGNNSLVPTHEGLPGPEIISDGRNITSISPDIHFAQGMECIDCHTSRDVMGDGYSYENMYLQVEIACEDCHGSAVEHPRVEIISKENDETLRESAKYKQPMLSGTQMVLTAKGRKYSNVFLKNNTVWVEGKRSGKLHESKIITGTPEHTIVGHERLECYVCHSRSVVQCYGCHTTYDQSQLGVDSIKQEMTPGLFSEAEDYRMLYPFPLALNQRGKVSTVTPGCQTFITVIDGEKQVALNEYVALYKGRQQLRFAPFFGHNVGTKAVSCGECHSNPAFLGFGQHVVEGNNIQATLLCEKSEEKPLDGYLLLEDGVVRSYSAITRENSRPLNGAEVKRTLAVNLCLICHDNPKDPIYQKRLDYSELENCLSRPVPAAKQ
ncbi:MAG: selenite/tellurite reduction operon c-type cytochrome ExtM [Desulfuromusa sp.]